MTDIPDFAYPKNVEAQARKSLEKALKENMPQEALRAFLNLEVASTLISNENIQGLIEKIDSVTSCLPSPYRALGHLIEARIYADIYQSDPIGFSNRTVTEEMKRRSPLFWDRDLFSQKIDSLILLALSEKKEASTMPLSKVSSLIESNSSLEGYSVYDFITFQAIDILESLGTRNSIPFFITEEPQISPLALVDQLLELHPDPSRPRTTAVLRKFDLLPEEEKETFLWNSIRDYGTSTAVVPLVTRYYNTFENEIESSDSSAKREGIDYIDFYRFVSRLKGEIKNSSELVKILKSMEAPDVKLEFPDMGATDNAINVKIQSINNLSFYVLLLDISSWDGHLSLSRTDLAEKAKVVEFRKVSFSKEIPFLAESVETFRINNPGKYTFIVSSSPLAKDIVKPGKTYRPATLEVSDIALVDLHPTFESSSDIKTGCFVVNAAYGAPVEGAKVSFATPQNHWSKKQSKTETVFSGKDGFAVTSLGQAEVKAEIAGSQAVSNLYVYRQSLPGQKARCRLFADRSVYRPSDTVRFFGILYETTESRAWLRSGQQIEVRLRNANYETVDSLSLTSDSSGRIFGEFKLPADGLLGAWWLDTDEDHCQIQVAEYKTPSLFVTLEKTGASADTIEFKGVVSTYSGIPLAESKVDYTVNFSPWWFFRSNNGEATFASSVTAGSDGEFKISLPTSNLTPEYYRGVFFIRASVTDQAGESADSPALLFWLTDCFSIQPSLPDVLEVTDHPSDFQVSVKDSAGAPVIKTVEYTIKDVEGLTVAEGELESPRFIPDLSTLPSGKYNFIFKIKNSADSPAAEASTIIYRKADKKPPVEVCLWVPETRLTAFDGKATVNFGCSFPGQYLLCIVSDSKGLTKTSWIVSDGCNSSLDIDGLKDDEVKFITLVAVRNHEFYKQTITVKPEAQTRNLRIETESFRNSLTPGENENWKFRVRLGESPAEGYAYALLYDKALEAINPLRWPTSLYNPVYPIWFSVEGKSIWERREEFRNGFGERPFVPKENFELQTYGYPLYEGIVYARAYKRSLRAETGGFVIQNDMASFEDCAMAMETTVTESALTSVTAEEVAEEGAGTDPGKMGGDVNFRPIEMPVAFFKPDLSTDSQGNLDISFEVPDFNTTWNLVIGAYNSDLKSASLFLETVASKKVMVKMVPPRFLRTGDRAVITATVYNNSTKDMDIQTQFEIFNPETGEILKTSATESLSMPPSGHRVISIDWNCPSDINTLGLRVYAKSDDFSDGEQTVIPVLPSSQPIVESATFYLDPGIEEFSFPLPEMEYEGRVTFKYCDNPLWEAVTALPPIIRPESESLTAQICALYANCVGHGIFNRNPNLKIGLGMILDGKADDSLLISNLEKDTQLKAVTLANTPWVNDARNETLRLSRLGTLLDDKEAEEAIRSVWGRILALRNPDGGWSWCPGMGSSQWMTEAFLVNVGLLEKGGYLPALPDKDSAVSQAINFVDGQYVDAYRKARSDKNWLYISMLPYLYTRSLFGSTDLSFSMRRLKDEALDYIESNWENLPIFSKATAAITLWRDNRRMTAREILESLRQFTSSSPGKGVWFDNLDSNWRGSGKLLATARVLMAFNEIQPSDTLIDGMRQWLLLQRQTQDWQEGLWSIDAIETLLTTGTDWSTGSLPPRISVAGREIGLNKIAGLTGAVTADIPLSEMGHSDIKIMRFGESPAWGGVISQYVAPVKEVKEASLADLSIEKQIWRIQEGPDGITAVAADSLKVGDKIKVTLIIDCRRDMDYVALTDARPACLEPSVNLSGYAVTDGLWCYRETRNSATNLFFNFMPRGRHIVNYECRVMEEGEFASGVATLQCLYSPLLTAHSAGSLLIVR